MDIEQVITSLVRFADETRLENMNRYGINTTQALGIPLSILRPYAKRIGTKHALALSLWNTDIHEARLISTIIDDPTQVTEDQMEQWAADFNSWDLCDQCCMNLFDKTGFVYKKINEWTDRQEEFVKRAGFVLIAVLAVHDKTAADSTFKRFFPLTIKECTDNRTYVKKAVSWALRSIGKRNISLNKKVIQIAEKMKEEKNKTAQWIASDILRELTSEKIQQRIRKKQ